jgi:hypothetical protein
MIYLEDFIERIANAVYNYEPYKNDNNILLSLKYKIVIEDLKDDSNKGFNVTDTDSSAYIATLGQYELVLFIPL